MAKIITVQFQRPRLPRRLLNDGWWLEQPPVRVPVIAFPKRSTPKPRRKSSHLTLVISRPLQSFPETGGSATCEHGVRNDN
jgi:hypothetical protein